MKAFMSVIFLCLVFCSTVFAEEEDLTETYADAGVPVREEALAARPSGVHGILGGDLFVTKRILGEGHTLVTISPLFLMRYKDVAYWNLTGGGVWLAQTDDRSLRFGAGLRSHAGWHPGDDPNLAGMATRRGSVDGYLNAVWRTPLATIGVHYYHDILRASRGDTASLRLSKTFWAGHGLLLIPSIGATWLNSERDDYYYGVRPEEALPTRPEYRGTATINANAGLAGLYPLSHSWSLLGGAFATRFGRGIVDSPIVTRRYSTFVFAGAGWRF